MWVLINDYLVNASNDLATELLINKEEVVKWHNFNEGATFYDSMGNPHIIKYINHKVKTVHL